MLNFRVCVNESLCPEEKNADMLLGCMALGLPFSDRNENMDTYCSEGEAKYGKLASEPVIAIWPSCLGLVFVHCSYQSPNV